MVKIGDFTYLQYCLTLDIEDYGLKCGNKEGRAKLTLPMGKEEERR